MSDVIEVSFCTRCKRVNRTLKSDFTFWRVPTGGNFKELSANADKWVVKKTTCETCNVLHELNRG